MQCNTRWKDLARWYSRYPGNTPKGFGLQISRRGRGHENIVRAPSFVVLLHVYVVPTPLGGTRTALNSKKLCFAVCALPIQRCLVLCGITDTYLHIHQIYGVVSIPGHGLFGPKPCQHYLGCRDACVVLLFTLIPYDRNSTTYEHSTQRPFCPCAHQTYQGHLDILQWARANGCPG